jgi:hypothetical protein
MTIAWTPEMDATACEQYRAGLTLLQIEAALGVSKDAVRWRVRKLGVAMRPRGQRLVWTPEMDAKLCELRAAGYGYQAAADEIGVVNVAVKRRVKALGLPTWGKGGGRRVAS